VRTLVIPSGLLLPETVLVSPWYAVLATFVAINTLMYGALAVSQILPKLYLSDFSRQRGRRAETRSIDPDAAP
jgi:hypothetical protein